MLSLPIDSHRDAILAALAQNSSLILSAPPGTGKSTRVPPLLRGGQGQVLVLQPRRIAARNLAQRVADELNSPLGQEVGYQVRFESKVSAQTKIIFQTYGLFFQRLLEDPQLQGVDAIVFDEFHERALDCDAALGFCKGLQATQRTDLKLVVMSATLEIQALTEYLAPAPLISVETRLYPVELRYQPPSLQEPLHDQVARALRGLMAQGLTGSGLIFMPGMGEIRRCVEALDPLCRRQGLRLLELQGSMDLSAQQAVLKLPEREACVIVTTNVAETSLTVPGVTWVIDSGLARIAAYNPERDMDTLYLRSISQHSAVQRAGRAGRTAPGICVRLWGQERERAMPLATEPEVHRVDLTAKALALHALCTDKLRYSTRYLLDWLETPTPALWDRAEANLQRIGALGAAGLSPLGRELLRLPLHPVPARALLEARQSGKGLVRETVAAMVTLLETETRRNTQNTADLLVQGFDLARDPEDRSVDREVREAFKQLTRGEKNKAEFPAKNHDGFQRLRATAIACFIPAYIDRLAMRLDKTQSFQLADGRKGVVEASQLSAEVNLILALEMHESGGAGKSKQISIPLLLPVLPEWIETAFPSEVAWKEVSEWDEVRGKTLNEKRLLFRGLILDRKPLLGAGAGSSEVLVEKLIAGEIQLPGFDEEAWQTVHRIRWAAKICPEQGFPVLDDEDWRLIYGEICEGKQSLRDLENVKVTDALRDYVGYSQWAWLEREAPTHRNVPSGKRAKFTYFESSPPEISARLGDFVGLEGKLFVLERKVQVTFDILAPNYRTVQKTQDLSSFWQNTYPEVKKELKRRYPRHPWP